MTYYPILKLSNAEMGALKNLKSETKELIIPIIESKVISQNKVDEWWVTFRTLGTYLHSKIGDSKFIYDFNSAFEKLGGVSELKDQDNTNLVLHCMEKMDKSELNYIPCIHFDSPNWIVESILNSNKDEIAIRIRCHDFNSTMEDLVVERIAEKMIDYHPKKNFIIILDFYNSQINYNRIITSIKKFSILNYNKIVLALTNCPEDADLAKPNTFTPIVPRNDLKNYKKAKSKFPELKYGDYTVRLRPEIEDRNINYYNTYLKIFYTSESAYFIGKSRLLENGGIETFIGICQAIITSNVYKGAAFSHGDQAIKNCAERKLTITNHSKPIEYGINHHLELTARQL